MKSILYIIFFYLLGAVVSYFIGGVIPASVIGMVLLFVALATKKINPQKVKPASDILLPNMLLFFVPIACGIVSSYALFKEHLWAVLVSSIVSTVLVLITVGGIAQFIIKKRSK